MFGSRYTGYDDTLSEFNLTSLQERRQNLLHWFGKKIFNSNTFCYLLPQLGTVQELSGPVHKLP